MGNKVFIGILAAIAIVTIVFIVQQDSSNPTLSRDDIGEIKGVEESKDLDRQHVQGAVEYPNTPPRGGNHSPVWVGCNQQVYTQPVQDGMAVHSLEHGAAWITYSPDLPKSQVETLADKVKTSVFTFMSPYPGLESPITLTAWGKQLSVENAQDPSIEKFLVKYRNGPDTPEPGATCVSPV